MPPSYDGSTAVPVVFSFHGLGSNALEQEIYSGFSTKSDSAGFIAVYPNGSVGGDGEQFWNAWQLAPPVPSDVAFVNAILDSIEASLCIDEHRVYTSGISNGAMMSVRLACSAASRFAAFAPVAGSYFPPMSLLINGSETCPDAVPRPMIAFHGTADNSVPFNGGGNVGYRLPIDDNTPAEDVLSDWAIYDACAGSRQESQVDTEVRLVQYGDCANGTLVELYIVDGGGHTWPGSFDVPSLGYTTHQINATDLIWSFFSSYSLDADDDTLGETNDNCPTVPNVDQADADADALGDACETSVYGTDPGNRDTDGDGCADGREVRTVAFPPSSGGGRNPLLASDFYDVNASAKADAIDIGQVRAKFNTAPPDPNYAVTHDRSPGARAWAPGAADGVINGVDIGLARASFLHSCQGSP